VVLSTRIQNSCCHFVEAICRPCCRSPRTTFRSLLPHDVTTLSIAGSWFQRKDIHLFSWASNDGHTRKEIDHVLLSRGNTAHQCKVYHSLDVDSDHFPVITALKLKVKRARPHQNTRFIPDLSALSKPAVRKLYAVTDNASAQEQSVENL